MEINSYSHIFNLGHRAVQDILDGPVIVEEKIDGSQFSFMQDNDGVNCRSRGKQVFLDDPGMFKLAVETAKDIAYLLEPHRIYRCEFLAKPKHNVLALLLRKDVVLLSAI